MATYLKVAKTLVYTFEIMLACKINGKWKIVKIAF
jgi:hypothetical protein